MCATSRKIFESEKEKNLNPGNDVCPSVTPFFSLRCNGGAKMRAKLFPPKMTRQVSFSMKIGADSVFDIRVHFAGMKFPLTFRDLNYR